VGDVGLRILKDAANSFEGLNRKAAATMNQVIPIFKCRFSLPCFLCNVHRKQGSGNPLDKTNNLV
jgi:hypothetical protein